MGKWQIHHDYQLIIQKIQRGVQRPDFGGGHSFQKCRRFSEGAILVMQVQQKVIRTKINQFLKQAYCSQRMHKKSSKAQQIFLLDMLLTKLKLLSNYSLYLTILRELRAIFLVINFIINVIEKFFKNLATLAGCLFYGFFYPIANTAFLMFTFKISKKVD